MYDTALIGLGRIASQYSSDLRMIENLNYFTHAQVLIDHSKFNWVGAVDPSNEAREHVKSNWKIDEVFSSVDKLKDKERYEVLVLATPPEHRLEIIKNFSSLKGVIVEKPLGISYPSSVQFIEECEKRNILVQVNLTRRSDNKMKEFSKGDMNRRIGNTQFVFGTYGRGIRNYATHLIDLIRMLVGEIASVQSLSSHKVFDSGPLEKDLNLSFMLKTQEGIQILMQPLDFSFYREGSLDFWGEKGRIEIVQEGLKFLESSIEDCRSLSNSKEIAIDNNIASDTGYGDALFNLYTNLAESISDNIKLDSPGRSALKTEFVIESLNKSFKENGKEIFC